MEREGVVRLCVCVCKLVVVVGGGGGVNYKVSYVMHYSVMFCNVLCIEHNTYNRRIWCIRKAFILVIEIVLLLGNLQSES